jgi:hypothetical protein
VADSETGRIVRRLTRTASSPHFESLQFIASAGAWAPDSTRFAFTAVSAGRPTITIVDMAQGGRMEERTLEEVQEAWHPSWSPDGARIVFSGLAGGLSDLYVYDLEQGHVHALTHDAFADFQPAWSPDGTRIAFVTDRFTSDLERLTFGDYRLAIVDANGGSNITPLPAFDHGKHITPQWTRAGDGLLLVAEPDGIPNIYRLDLSQRRFERITNVATGISGITELSPALSFAPAADRIVFTVFLSGGYAVQLLDNTRSDGQPLRLTDDTSRLPGGETTALVEQAQARAEQMTATEQPYPVEPYHARLSLQFAGAAGGVGQYGQYGTFANGGVSLLFSDILNRHQLATTIQAMGDLRDIGGQAIYLNTEHRWAWGGIGAMIPYVTGAFAQSLQPASGGTVLVEQELIDRQTEADFIGVAQYPFSRASRFEVQAGARRIWFNRELTTRAFSNITGEFLGETTESLGSQPALNLGDTAAALVYDQATFGATGPIVGQRYRFEVGQTVGSLRFSTLTLDYRRYLPLVRPFTLAVRALHFGRYGSAGEDPRLSPLFLGYPTLVRGYDVNSFGAGECIPDAQSECPVFDQLLGSRLLVGNAELRVPLVGAFTGEYRYGPLPIDAFAFADTGVAWTKSVSPSFADGSRDFVTSVGGGIRMNVFGYVIFELAAIRPLNRPGQGWQFGFNLNQGF